MVTRNAPPLAYEDLTPADAANRGTPAPRGEAPGAIAELGNRDVDFSAALAAEVRNLAEQLTSRVPNPLQQFLTELVPSAPEYLYSDRVPALSVWQIGAVAIHCADAAYVIVWLDDHQSGNILIATESSAHGLLTAKFPALYLRAGQRLCVEVLVGAGAPIFVGITGVQHSG